jgi:hypothetical protein
MIRSRHYRGERFFENLLAAGAPLAASERRAGNYSSFAYSALACVRIGMSGSASLQRVKKSW